MFKFEGFELYPDRRLLLQNGQPRRLGSRAFDLLVGLVCRAGQIVSSVDLLAAAWPSTVVEEVNLRVHIATLRKTLGDDPLAPRYISTVPGRGYCFVAPLMRPHSEIPERASRPTPFARHPLPPLAGRVIGRAQAVHDLAKAVTTRRFVSIVGPGGIGKTTVAVKIAGTAARHFAQGVAFVDLTSVSDGRMVAAALATALGVALEAEDQAAELAAHLHGKQMLIVLDNCEHVVDAAATLVESLIEVVDIHVLTTSREVLRANGEWVHRLPALALPAQGEALSADEAMRSPAVELFVERIAASMGGYELTDGDTEAVTEICRKLDGLALAIELAAGRVGTMGVSGLASSLGVSLSLLTHGRRTAQARHQTLRATMDWSYRLLSAPEQAVFRRLGLLRGEFQLDAARAVSTSTEVTPERVVEYLHSLVAKSLVVATHQTGSVSYRLLATSSAFAIEMLDEAGDRPQAARQHAAYFRQVIEKAEKEWETRLTSDWLDGYTFHISNLLAALEWAFAADGDATIGIALAAAAVPLWFELSQVEEGLRWVYRALEVMADDANLHHQMRLYSVLGWPSMRARSNLPTGAAAWAIAKRLAEALGCTDFQLRALLALWADRLNCGDPRASLVLAEQFCQLEMTVESPEYAIGARLRARSLHILGHQREALAEVSAMLGRYVTPVSRSHIVRYQNDSQVAARIVHARVLWLSGFPDQAVRETEENIAHARSLGHTLTLAYALADGACPVALMVGDLGLAARFTNLLENSTQSKALDVWRSYADCFYGELLIRDGKTEQGITMLRQAAAALERSGFVMYRTSFLAALARGFAGLMLLQEGQQLIDAALDHCDRTGEAWCVPELFRICGVLRLLQGDTASADMYFRRALALADQQGAISWALRTSLDLARLLMSGGQAREARILLTTVYDKFTEGFETIDLISARELLAKLPVLP